MIKIYKNIFEEDLIKYIFNYFKDKTKQHVWASNISWDQNLSLNSTNILTHRIEDKHLYKLIKKNIENKINLNDQNLNFDCSLYVWGCGSYISWHTDEDYPYNGTIYLNKEWDSNDGGIFLYKDNRTKKIIGIEPEYNLMVVNYEDGEDKHTTHCVTCILPSVIKKRITIQWRFYKKNNSNKILYH